MLFIPIEFWADVNPKRVLRVFIVITELTPVVGAVKTILLSSLRVAKVKETPYIVSKADPDNWVETNDLKIEFILLN